MHSLDAGVACGLLACTAVITACAAAIAVKPVLSIVGLFRVAPLWIISLANTDEEKAGILK